MRAYDLRAVLVAAFTLLAGTAFGHDEGSQAPGARPTAVGHSGGRAHSARRSGESSARLSNTAARPNGDPPPSTSSSRERGAYEANMGYGGASSLTGAPPDDWTTNDGVRRRPVNDRFGPTRLTAPADGAPSPPPKRMGSLVVTIALIGAILAVLFVLIWIVVGRLEEVGRLSWIDDQLNLLPEVRTWERRRFTVVDVLGVLVPRQMRLEDEIGYLSRTITLLENQIKQLSQAQAQTAAPPPTAVRIPRILPPAPRPDAVYGSPPEPPPSPPPPPPPPQLAEIEAQFRAVAGSKARARLREYWDRYGARGVSAGSSGALRIEAGASSPYLQAIELGGDLVAILPGDDIVVSFSTLFCTERSMPQEMREAFDFEVDDTRNLSLINASVWRRNAFGELQLERRGRIGGLTR